jgi:hypothetical protein
MKLLIFPTKIKDNKKKEDFIYSFPQEMRELFLYPTNSATWVLIYGNQEFFK